MTDDEFLRQLADLKTRLATAEKGRDNFQMACRVDQEFIREVHALTVPRKQYTFHQEMLDRISALRADAAEGRRLLGGVRETLEAVRTGNATAEDEAVLRYGRAWRNEYIDDRLSDIEAHLARAPVESEPSGPKDPTGYTQGELLAIHQGLAEELADEVERLGGLCELAWGIIANAQGGNWDLASAEWREAAVKWRDSYHAAKRGGEKE